MPSRQEPEVITLSDTDEQESQDLFESPIDEKKSRNCTDDSDDLFSSPEQTEDVLIIEPRSKKPSSLSPKLVLKNGIDPRNLNGKIRRSSSVIVSPRKSLTPSVIWRRKRSSNGSTEEKSPLHGTLSRKFSPGKVKRIGPPERKVKSDPWTNIKLGEISKKFEERNKIMTELVQRDKDFLNIVHGGALERVQKEAKERLVEGAVIRNKADRARMKGVTCAASKAYFDALELSPDSKERRINEISRVRVVAQKMPSTPENYWEVGFPSESEQRRRGLIKEICCPVEYLIFSCAVTANGLSLK
ncbi:unnamed protein product [Haemonchus placei]|uniref:BUD22 domain-containing protein n=1 Tax=Haemonchus placei TaxID=6290 RepID=A0A0N4WME1_HAEPC|nr:unnamed protein product [Haemonchus placei]